MTAEAARFGRERRIAKAHEFAAILKVGRRGATSLINVCIRPAQGLGRVGISASVKIGGSVERNRARRIVREHYRQTQRGSGPYDIVVSLKPGFAELSAADAGKTFDEALSKAIGAGKRVGQGPHPGNRRV